jgi:hypothetical protein
MVPREMPPVEGKAMVKAAEFPNNTLPPEHDPCRALVPFAINQSLSVYNVSAVATFYEMERVSNIRP